MNKKISKLMDGHNARPHRHKSKPNSLDACKVLARRAGVEKYTQKYCQYSAINALKLYHNNNNNTNECNDDTVHTSDDNIDVSFVYYRSSRLLFRIVSPPIEKLELIEIDPQLYSMPKPIIMPNYSKGGHQNTKKKKSKSSKRVSFADHTIETETDSQSFVGIEPEVIISTPPHVVWFGDQSAETIHIPITNNIDGKVLEAIIAPFDNDGQLCFLVKWEGTDRCDVCDNRVLSQRWPQMVIKYLQERTLFE